MRADVSERTDQEAHFRTLKNALRPGGWVMIARFAPGCPMTCSGLPFVHHDASSLLRLLGNELMLIETRGETHRTPAGAEQAFRYHLFRRVG